MGRERPDWMQYPPLAGILSHSVRDPAAVMNLPDHAFMRGCGRALDGEDVLFLCPTGGVEGATLAFKAQELFNHWRVLPDGGWNVTTLPDQLEGISHVVWVLASHSEGADARDGSEDTRNAVVAGFAERCGARLYVLVSESARTVVDVEARALRFATLEEFSTARQRTAAHGRKRVPASPAAPPAPQGAIDFSLFISKATQDFVGRDWLAAQVDTFLQQHERGYVRIEALPGMGKTAFAANLARTRRWPHHFNARRVGIVTFEAFLRNVRAQLVTTYSLELRAPAAHDAEHVLFVESMLDDASRQLTARGNRAVIVIDGLDEAEPGPEGSQPLFLPTNLPSGIRIVVLGRPDPFNRLALDQPVLPLTIDPADPENSRDVRAFLYHAAHGALAAALAVQGKTADWFVAAMADASQGNFMYVRSVVNDILAGSHVVADLGTLVLILASSAAHRVQDLHDSFALRPQNLVSSRVVSTGLLPMASTTLSLSL